MIVVDTTVLVYAVGADHAHREPSRALVEAVEQGRLRATTTLEVIQEFAHVRARRRGRQDAVRHARAYADVFAPLLLPVREDLDSGLALFRQHGRLGAFDALLAAAAIRAGAEALVSADRAFAGVGGVRFVELGEPGLAGLLS